MTTRLAITILTVLTSLITFGKTKEIELVDYWQIISVEKDSTLEINQSKIVLFIEDKHSATPIINTSVHTNINTFIGKTDSTGKITHIFNSGNNRFCADTEEGNSFSTTKNFLPQHVYVVKVFMNTYPTIEYIDNPNIYPVAEKPVIYLYPTKSTKVAVKVLPKGDFTFTYPKYSTSGWSVLAKPNGELKIDDKLYNYLFWEATMPNKGDFNMTKGFIVHSDTVVDFLENTLTTVGLNSFEQADFITYWAPRLQQNELNIIHFEFNEGFDKLVSNLEISPKPESLIRVFMAYKAYDNLTENLIKPQHIPNYKRTGFTAVEWGGTQF